jgi:RNA polymerase sigma-70 factor (ECF subfamily)
VRSGPIDGESARQLYEAHGRALLAYACSLTPDSSVAEDVLHQVFVRLLAGRVTITAPALPYLLRAVRNTALNHRRGRQREAPLTEADRWLEAPPDRSDEALAVQSALRRLPAEQREVVILRLWAGLTFAEVATVVGCPMNTAASRYRYGRDRLRALLQPLEGESDG